MKTAYFLRGALVTWGAFGMCGGLFGCTLTSEGLEKEAEEAIDDLENTVICDGMTYEELLDAVTISEGCKAELQSYLPQPENNFEDRLISFGEVENEDGSLSVFLQGVDDTGAALVGADWDALEVSATVGGSAEVLAEGSFTVTASADFSGDLFSVSFVNDYSGSMSDGDLELTAEIEQDVLSVLPDVFEGEVTLFSTEVSVTQTFTEDRQTLVDAVAYDATFERDLTALYDGMGTGLASLITRERPLRLLVVATDGQENSSVDFTKNELISTTLDENVCVLILGSLFSDPDELSDFAGGCGAYFYTPGYGALKGAVSEYVEALGGMIEVNIPAAVRGEGEIVLSVGELSVTVE